MNWLIAKVLGVDANKAMGHVASGLGTVATMIDERKFTPEEESKANMKLVDNALAFQKEQDTQNTDRSKARRTVAINWINFYLHRLIPGYLLSVLASCYYPAIIPLVDATKEVMIIMGTGTLMVLGFFFGTHLVRGVNGMFKKG